VLGTALGTLSPGWLGLSCLGVHEDARRRGWARIMIAALAAWARPQGANGLWLEVEADNEAALALYRPLGLRRFGGYRYFCTEEPTSEAEVPTSEALTAGSTPFSCTHLRALLPTPHVGRLVCWS
jgi:hypothetical protein